MPRMSSFTKENINEWEELRPGYEQKLSYDGQSVGTVAVLIDLHSYLTLLS